MVRVAVSRFLACCLAALFLASGAPATASGTDFALTTIAPGVYFHAGALADLDSPARADSANVGFIVGERCVAVIDSGGAIATGRALAAAIARTTDKPVCYVINTHVHFDHVLGNAAFSGNDTRFVGHQELGEVMAANREYFAEHFAAELEGAGGAARVIGPDQLVADTTELDLGGRTLVLRAVQRAHTTTDLTVHDRATDTLWAGDLLFRDRLPVVDGSLKGWLAWMAQARAQGYARVVPGHGPVDAGWPAGSDAQLAYLEALRDDTRAAIAAGTFIEDAREAIARPEREEFALTRRAHAVNVSRAFRELEWE
ncbi:MAG: quinoprotein relay system zinc metallohydrolase 2 [Gammaproteobacteria bacterium]